MRYLFLLPLLLLLACNATSDPITEPVAPETVETALPRVPDWHKNATIYEVNLRHYTPEGTLVAFQEHLPRLKEMGVDILWFMPVHPISEINRKGELGSPYAVADYRGVNPDFGTKENFRATMEAIHDLGMHAIIDWVPNHTGWDNPWITEHPEWYTKGPDGEITDPINYDTGESWGWTDVADLNYDVPEMRQAMIDAMAYWVTDMDVDGFRVDVAHGVPPEFWEEASEQLYAIEPLFMLAEAEVPELRNNVAFVMDYAWAMHHIFNDIARAQGINADAGQLEKGNFVEGEVVGIKASALDIDRQLEKYHEQYGQGYKMHFTSNHDENAWAGTEFTRFGDGYEAFAVLVATFDGMPLLYTGMESGDDQQYEFFTKDEVEWGDYKYADFYKTLFDLKHRNEALWNGKHGGELVKISTGKDELIYAFTREKNGDRVIAMLNLSAQSVTFTPELDGLTGNYTEVFDRRPMALEAGPRTLAPWEYVLLEQ